MDRINNKMFILMLTYTGQNLIHGPSISEYILTILSLINELSKLIKNKQNDYIKMCEKRWK